MDRALPGEKTRDSFAIQRRLPVLAPALMISSLAFSSEQAYSDPSKDMCHKESVNPRPTTNLIGAAARQCHCEDQSLNVWPGGPRAPRGQRADSGQSNMSDRGEFLFRLGGHDSGGRTLPPSTASARSASPTCSSPSPRFRLDCSDRGLFRCMIRLKNARQAKASGANNLAQRALPRA